MLHKKKPAIEKWPVFNFSNICCIYFLLIKNCFQASVFDLKIKVVEVCLSESAGLTQCNRWRGRISPGF
jgi:hypothetical protein